ncbi:MAG: YqgE/AlgH family protein [Bacteroidia bacterium]|nr:YqgE/AlgH family protein [Bacteroidia bacterium]
MEIREINTQFKAKRGSLLLSEPFMLDPSFKKSVVLLTDHQTDGSVGFVLNRLYPLTSMELIPELLETDFPLYTGGPVEPNTLHFIHRKKECIPEANEIAPGIFWGGSIEQVNDCLNAGRANMSDFRFFIGYSGWAPGQLEEEMELKSWWTLDATSNLVFETDPNFLWEAAVKTLGLDYAYLAQAPENLAWN